MVSRAAKSLIVVGCLVSGLAQAWGSDTHKLIQSQAYKQLSPESISFVEAVLGAPPALLWLNLDQNFYDRQVNQTSRWERNLHHNLMPRSDDTFDPDRHCAKRDCLVAGVLSSYRVLQDQSRTPAEHQRALTFFVVLAARLHQPLNAGFTEDTGGRLVVIEAGDSDVNLKWIWEVGMFQRQGSDWQMQSASWPMPDDLPAFDGMNALDWLAESRALAVDELYLASIEAKWPSLGGQYQDFWQYQINLAAMRIAESINDLFAEEELMMTDQ